MSTARPDFHALSINCYKPHPLHPNTENATKRVIFTLLMIQGNQEVIFKVASEFLPMIIEVYRALINEISSIPRAKVENWLFLHILSRTPLRTGEFAQESCAGMPSQRVIKK
ncbi:hypothetical protein I3760_07G035100 [Carya illinoinensis]|nr:hypothetical protein I3760_07G035100 [Carya illinoinensis]